MQLVEKHIINKSHPDWAECNQICQHANTIRNQALYVQRQSWFYGHGVIKFGKTEEHRNIDALMKSYPCYHALPAFLAQQVVKSLNAEWTGFFNALKEWKINPSQFTGRPKPPNYKPRTGRYKAEYPNTRALKNSKKQGIIHLYSSNIQIKTTHALNYDCVRIVPATGCYVIEVVYTVEDIPVQDSSFVAALDLGVNVLGAVTTNKLGFQPILINGRPIKSINNRYNKTISELRSINKKLHGIDWSGRMELLTRRRNHKIDSYLHRASSLIIKTLVRERIGTLVIGLNPDWKRDCNMGKVNNQKFVQIPHRKFVDMLIYKGAINGIKVYTRDEAYTSKASFLDLDTIPEFGNKPEDWNPSGRRIKRGLYQSKSGSLIQSDVNASYNILRKEFPNAFSQGIKGCVVQPRLVNIPGFTPKPALCRICCPVSY
ncbi:MAG: transposase [Scytonema sp. PMC 1069.18]|nr:transposase [Scytonema sp. PMC 1069.18]MEC4886939.1 transposase [Scytonema sp. PMC 1070.18]